LVVVRGRPLRASEVAWRLGISKSAATRLLDRGESVALIDKLTPAFDRRGVWARLTSKGRSLQHVVQRIVEDTAFLRRTPGKAYAIRATNWNDPD
jgi:DNA-binding MarR family transcriptional regulator